MAVGFLSVLIDSTNPRLAKLRAATSAAESGSSITGKTFVLAYRRPVRDVDAAIRRSLSDLMRCGYRLAGEDDLFDAPLYQIIATVNGACLASDELEVSGQTCAKHDLLEEANLIAIGEDYELGRGAPADLSRAMKAYEQAAMLGSPNGSVSAARLAQTGGPELNRVNTAAELYTKAVSQGWWHCYGFLAGLYQQAGQPELAAEYWKILFAVAAEKLGHDDIGTRHRMGAAGAKYACSVATGAIDHLVPNDLISPFAEEIIAELQQTAAVGQPEDHRQLLGKTRAIRFIKEVILEEQSGT